MLMPNEAHSFVLTARSAASGLPAALQRTNNRLARHTRCTAIRARGRGSTVATRPLIARPTGRQYRGSELAASAICSGRPEAANRPSPAFSGPA